MSLTILVLAVIVVLVAAFVLLNRRNAAAVPAAQPDNVEDDGVVSEPVPVNGTAQVAEPNGVTWTKQFDASSEPLDDAARLRLIDDLGMLRASWCIPLLEQALREETDPAHRDAAQRALASCREQHA